MKIAHAPQTRIVRDGVTTVVPNALGMGKKARSADALVADQHADSGLNDKGTRVLKYPVTRVSLRGVR